MSVEIDSEGYARGYELGRPKYRELQHPPLSFTLGKVVHSCPEDAWRMTQRSERVEREQSDAMDDGSIMDALLTAAEITDASRLLAPPIAGEPAPVAIRLWTAATKKPTDPVEYLDWNGLRVILAESLQTKAAKEAAADARAKDLTPVLAAKFEREVRKAQDMLVRMELAGFRRENYHYQVSLYWTEQGANGRTIQCRGRLDFLKKDWTEVVDLKRVEALDERALQNAVDRYKWAMQAAAYSRAVYMLQDVGNVPTWHWLFARTAPVVACTLRPVAAHLLQAGEAAWNRAVNEWAEGLQTGLWRGHESNHAAIEPTSYALAQMEVDLV